MICNLGVVGSNPTRGSPKEGSVSKRNRPIPSPAVGAGFACPKTQSKLFLGEQTLPLRTKRQHYPGFNTPHLFLIVSFSQETRGIVCESCYDGIRTEVSRTIIRIDITSEPPTIIPPPNNNAIALGSVIFENSRSSEKRAIEKKRGSIRNPCGCFM